MFLIDFATKCIEKYLQNQTFCYKLSNVLKVFHVISYNNDVNRKGKHKE